MISPARTSEPIADLVEALRRQIKHGPARLAADLERLHGVTVAPATVHRILVRRGINRLRDLDPRRPVSKCARSSDTSTTASATWSTSTSKGSDAPIGGGWRMHGVGTDAARASSRTGPGTRVGYTYLRSALDDHSRLAYTEAPDDEKVVTAVAFWHRAVAIFAAHTSPRSAAS